MMVGEYTKIQGGDTIKRNYTTVAYDFRETAPADSTADMFKANPDLAQKVSLKCLQSHGGLTANFMKNFKNFIKTVTAIYFDRRYLTFYTNLSNGIVSHEFQLRFLSTIHTDTNSAMQDQVLTVV